MTVFQTHFSKKRKYDTSTDCYYLAILKLSVCIKLPKSPPPSTRFSPVTSANVGFGPQNLLTFCFNSFATLVQNFKFVPSASPKLLNLNQDHPSKKRFFWSNPYKIEVMITILIEMLQLPNFGHITISKI